MKRQALTLLALGGAMGLAACGNILGLKDLEPYPSEGGTAEGGDDTQEETSPDSPMMGDDTSTHDAHEATTSDAREDDGAVVVDATEEDAMATEVGSDVVVTDTSMNDVVTPMDAPPDTTPPMDAPPGCEGGETSCSGTCVDLNSSQHHCGSCTHDCLGGACSGGVCQPYLFVASTAHDMIVVGTTLYWVDEGAPQGNVWGCSTTAATCGSLISVATGQADPTRIAYDGTSCLYWSNSNNGSNGGSIGSYKLGTIACLGPYTGLGAPQGVAADGTHVFWTDTFRNQVVQAVSGSSPTAYAITGTDVPPVAVAAMGGKVYWADYGTMAGLGSISQGTPGSGFPSPVTPVQSSLNFPWAFYVAGATTLYWVDDDVPSMTGEVWVDQSGTVTELFTGEVEPIRVAGDDKALYWVDQGSTNNNGTLRTCDVTAGCTTATTVKGTLANPEGLAITPTDVFFSSPMAQAIYRLVRP